MTRVVAYLALLTDTYPSIDEEQVVELSIPYPNAKTELSQWMPLVKYSLAIPHYIVLGFLDAVTVIIIIVAWFAILFGGRSEEPVRLRGWRVPLASESRGLYASVDNGRVSAVYVGIGEAAAQHFSRLAVNMCI